MLRSVSFSDIRVSVAQQCQGFLERLFGKPWPGKKQAGYHSLLNEQALQQLHAIATAPNSDRLMSQHEVKTLLVGERSSVYSGSGYEFADNQLYVAGDDSRFINWRMLARTGKLYRKVFNEERRPQLWVVVDKRASMRFGTSKRLKVTQAAIHAIYQLYQAQQQQLACAGVIINDTPCWFNPVQTMEALQPLVQKIIEPAPPLFVEKGRTVLSGTLRQLVERLSAGSIVILISDFHDVQNDMLDTLHRLASRHTVIAKHIIDPMELALPEHGKFQVTSQQDMATLTLDCDDTTLRQRYQAEMKHRQDTIETRLVCAGVHYQLCRSDEDIINETDYD